MKIVLKVFIDILDLIFINGTLCNVKKKKDFSKSMLRDVTLLKIFVYIDLSFMYICSRPIKVQDEMNFLLFFFAMFPVFIAIIHFTLYSHVQCLPYTYVHYSMIDLINVSLIQTSSKIEFQLA